ncbi:MAG: response regulator [Ideonella sp.]
MNNAAKYTPAGGQIKVGARLVDGMVRVTVSDTGIGIPASMLLHVFDMFTQVDRSFDRSQTGLGIGLPFVRQLIAMHGGIVEIFSGGENQGTSIFVRLPGVAGAPQPEVENESNSTAPQAVGSVLVVDDNHDVGDSLSELLQLVGYQTVVARNGHQAIALAAAHHPEIALVDIGLPDIDGHEVARRLRADPQRSGMFLVALTGWGQDDDRRRSHQAGFDQHLVKPVDIDRLLDILQSAAQRQGGGE